MGKMGEKKMDAKGKRGREIKRVRVGEREAATSRGCVTVKLVRSRSEGYDETRFDA